MLTLLLELLADLPIKLLHLVRKKVMCLISSQDGSPLAPLKEDDLTVAQAQVLIRANDPLYEIAFRMGGSKAEDTFRMHTLESLAASFGVDDRVHISSTCVDPKLQWSQAKNIWYNAAIRSAVYAAFAPARWVYGIVMRH